MGYGRMLARSNAAAALPSRYTDRAGMYLVSGSKDHDVRVWEWQERDQRYRPRLRRHCAAPPC